MQIESNIKCVKNNWIAYITYGNTRIWADIRDFNELDELFVSLTYQMAKFKLKTDFYE